MKKGRAYLCVMFMLCLCMTACGSVQDKSKNEDVPVSEAAQEDGGSSEPEVQEDAASVHDSLEDGGESDAVSFDPGTEEDIGMTATDSVYTCGEMSVTLPESWVGKVDVKETDTGFYFVQKASAEEEPGLGFMCGFYRANEIVYNFAGEVPLACTGDTIYYAQEPTDMPCSTKPKIMNEYGLMMGKLSQVQRSFQVDREDVRYSYGEYMMFGSDVAEIPEDILINLNTYELWIARNEIFARHGRKFDNYYLQSYFDTCSWYQGTIDGADFDESVLSETEKNNIEQIKKMEAKRAAEKPYPIRYGAEQTAQEDLDGDGKKEKITMLIRQQKRILTEYTYESQIALCIDGTEFDLADMGLYFDDANTECFYITDIWSFEAGLEVAVMDYGPSSDLVTHFFRYDGQLSYVGAVPGFPFKEYGFDGFYVDGGIYSIMRADIISSAYAYGYWWGDSTSHTLYYQKGSCRMVSDGPHRLLVDLPVYDYMGEEADTFEMKAGGEVYFVETDAEEWIGVKLKEDHIVGYIRYRDCLVDPVGKEPDEVFSDLQYFD